MKALLIDSVNKKVKTVNLTNVDDNILEQCYELMNVKDVEIGLTIKNGDCILVDEEGLFKHYQHGFSYEGNYFLGNGMVVRVDDKGDEIDCKSSQKEITKTIKFHDRKDLGEVYESSTPMSF